MWAPPKCYVVSFMEPILLVKDMMRKHSLLQKELFRRPSLYLHINNYPAGPFMQALLKTIFHTPNSADQRVDYDFAEAERILLRDGMDQRQVPALTKLVFEQCVDIVTTHIPHLAFDTHQDVLYDLMEEYDVMVSVCQTEVADQRED